jgi:hypothetical protein
LSRFATRLDRLAARRQPARCPVRCEFPPHVTVVAGAARPALPDGPCLACGRWPRIRAIIAEIPAEVAEEYS